MPLKLGTLGAALALAVAAPGASAADRQGTVTPSAPYEWDGAAASGANVNYDSTTGEPCGKEASTYCDTTLIRVEPPAARSGLKSVGLSVSIREFSPNPGSDFDLYVYESDAGGRRGSLKAAVGDPPGVEEATTVAEPEGWYLVQVVYYAVAQSSYKGRIAFQGTRSAHPPDVDDPPGMQGFLGSDPTLGFRSHSEPHIAQDPRNPDLLVAGSKYYDRDPDSLAEYEFKIGTSVSFDGGYSWTSLGQLDVCPPERAGPATWPRNECYPADDPARAGTGEEDRNDPRPRGDFGEEYTTSDVWLDFDDEGNAYAMVLDHPPFASGAGWGMSFHRWETPSAGDLERGATWSHRIPINAYEDELRRDAFLDDKNTFAVNNAGPDGDGRTGPIVACWTQNVEPLIKQQIVCERSTDGGRAWPGEPLPISGVHQLVIGVHVFADLRDEDVFYATWRAYEPGVAGGPNVLYFTRSLDGGRTFLPPQPIGTFQDLPIFPNNAFRNGIIPIGAAGPEGEVYITLADYNATGDPADEDGMQADVKLLKSSDGGVTFDPPVTVNQDKGRADQFQPYVAVAPSGQVNVAFFDRRLDPRIARDGGVLHPGNFFIDLFLARSPDGGRTWKETRLTHDAWDPSINPPISGSGEFIGDYQGLVADDCRAVAFFNDTTLANDPARDPEFDRGLPRSPFQQTFAYVVPNAAAFGGGGAPPACDTRVRRTAKPPRSALAPCARSSALERIAVRPRRRGLSFSMRGRRSRRVRVDVFQSSAGTRVLGNRRIARLGARRRSFTWSGRPTARRSIGAGVFFVRLTAGRASKRLVFERRGGRFVRRRTFDLPPTCRLVRELKLGRPVFGGRFNRPLSIAFRLARSSRATVELLRGRRVVRRIGRPALRRAGITHRLQLRSERLRRGTYRIRVRAGRASASVYAIRL